MTKVNPRKTLDEIMENREYELNPNHIGDWTFCSASYPFTIIKRDMPSDRIQKFNIAAAISAPKSIKYRQVNFEFEGGKPGDYMFVDRSGGTMSIPYQLFKRLF